jgi:hypothetical protein
VKRRCQRRPLDLGRKTTGGACVSAKEGGVAGWAGQRPRPSGGWRWQPNGRGKGSGPAEVEGEVGRSRAESGAGPDFKKKLFLNFN